MKGVSEERKVAMVSSPPRNNPPLRRQFPCHQSSKDRSSYTLLEKMDKKWQCPYCLFSRNLVSYLLHHSTHTP